MAVLGGNGEIFMECQAVILYNRNECELGGVMLVTSRL